MPAKEQETLETEIAKINKKMPRVREDYSRVVGYLRPVQGWNTGAQDGCLAENYANRNPQT